MANTFRCSIVTPSESVFDDVVTYASIPAWDGQLGVMTGQSPLLTRLGVGSLRLDFQEGGSRWYLVDGGFAQIQDGMLALVTDDALPAETLSLADAEAEVEATSKAVTEAGADRPVVERNQQRALAKKALAAAAAGRDRAI